MSRTTFLSAVLALLLSVFPATAWGWATKEHILLTRLAAERLIADPTTPPAMKDWLLAADPRAPDLAGQEEWFMHAYIGIYPHGVDGVGFWATMPDVLRQPDPVEKKIAPFGVGETKLHFVDLEYFMPNEGDRRYFDDLSHKPRLSDFPRDMSDPRWQKAGMLPFRVEQCYGDLVKSIREHRLNDAPGQFPREEHAAKWAGYLAHYIEDGTQPQHATEDFKSASYFSNVTRAPNVHSDVEFRLDDDDRADYPELRAEFWKQFVKDLDAVDDPIQTTDPWQATMEELLISYDALPLIGRAAMAAYGQKGTPGKPEGQIDGTFDADAFFHTRGLFRGQEMTMLQMKSRQMAWAVKRVQRTWRQAWDEAQLPAATQPAGK